METQVISRKKVFKKDYSCNCCKFKATQRIINHGQKTELKKEL